MLENELEPVNDDSPPTNTAIKALNDSGRVGGYLVVWGNPQQRDLQGEYFTPDSELCLDWYDRRPMLYHHGLDGTLKSDIVGVIDFLKEDDTGVWAEAQLDLRNRYVDTVHKLIKQGVLGWSSGSLPHLVRVEKGHIKYWPIVEGSATPTPAEPRQTDINSIKSAYESLGLSLEPLQLTVTPAESTSETTAIEPPAKEPEASTADSVNDNEQDPTENEAMNIQEVIAAVIAAVVQSGVDLSEEQQRMIAEQVMASMQQEVPAEGTAALTEEKASALVPMVAKAVSAEIAKIQQQRAVIDHAAKTAIAGMVAIAAPASKANGFVAPNGGNQQPVANIQMRTKYAGMSAEDMSYFIHLRNAVRSRQGLPRWTPDSQFIRELADKAGKAFEAGDLHFGDEKETAAAIKSINFYKANELDHSTQSGFGDEWVPDLWSSQLWERVRLDNEIAPLFQNIEMPSNPFELPIESTDPTVYYVPETTAETELLLSGSGAVIPDSKVATGKVTLTARKLALRVGFSTELEEDSIIPFTGQLRKQALRAIEDSIDNVLLNGDTDASASTNINLIDGTPAATAKYLAQNGILKLPLITTTANAISMGGAAPTLAKIREARFAMSTNYASRPDDITYIVDGSVYAKLLAIPEFLTMDVIGPQATVLTGQVGKIDGSPVVVSNEMALANSAGKIPNAGGTLGRIAVVYRPGWYVGYRRRVNAVVDYLAWADSYQMTATVRLAFINRDAEVSSVLYNIAV